MTDTSREAVERLIQNINRSVVPWPITGDITSMLTALCAERDAAQAERDEAVTLIRNVVDGTWKLHYTQQVIEVFSRFIADVDAKHQR
jgi:hypothetical protein